MRKAAGVSRVNQAHTKDILELLSSAMYVEPLTIYREYLQNSADSIDEGIKEGLLQNEEEGRVDINVDPLNRIVTIRDNGVGLSKKDCSDIVNEIIEQIINGLIDQNIFKIHNFGTFRLRKKQPRIESTMQKFIKSKPSYEKAVFLRKTSIWLHSGCTFTALENHENHDFVRSEGPKVL